MKSWNTKINYNFFNVWKIESRFSSFVSRIKEFVFLGKKRRVLKKALNADKIREAKEAKESLSRLKLLEAQREEILEQLEEAKERVVEIANPALQSNLEDLAAIAG